MKMDLISFPVFSRAIVAAGLLTLASCDDDASGEASSTSTAMTTSEATSETTPTSEATSTSGVESTSGDQTSTSTSGASSETGTPTSESDSSDTSGSSSDSSSGTTGVQPPPYGVCQASCTEDQDCCGALGLPPELCAVLAPTCEDSLCSLGGDECAEDEDCVNAGLGDTCRNEFGIRSCRNTCAQDDECQALNPDLECVDWMSPDPDWFDVGACALPPQ